MKKSTIIIITVIFTLAVGAAIFFTATPAGRAIITSYRHDLSKADENNYKNRRDVENTCRAYISSYNSDKLAYEQYKNSSDEYYQRLAESYKQRANQTAMTYNEYFLKNSYVWENNIPADICSELAILE